MQDTLEAPRATAPLPAERPVASPRASSVGRGLRLALVGVVSGVVATVVVWRLGYVASFTSLAAATASTALYARGAGAAFRRGLVPLVLLVVAGLAVSFVAVVASDAWDASGMLVGPGPVSRAGFVLQVLADPDVLGSYARDAVTSAVLATVGLVGVVRRSLRSATSRS